MKEPYAEGLASYTGSGNQRLATGQPNLRFVILRIGRTIAPHGTTTCQQHPQSLIAHWRRRFSLAELGWVGWFRLTRG